MTERGKKRASAEELDVANWKYPDEGAFPESVYHLYKARKRGIELYFAGATAQLIKAEVGLSSSYISKLIRKRCLAVHSDGEVWGWRGLIPNIRIAPYHRKQLVEVDRFGFGASGALTSLLNQNPELRRKFEKRILSAPGSSSLSVGIRYKTIHFRWFLQELRVLGLDRQKAWPFNTEKLGYVSICKYISKLFEKNPSRGAFVSGGVDAQKKLSSGDGVARPVEKLFQRVEMDAHKLDGIFTISIPQPTGGYTQKVIHRLWVVVIIELISRAVIGYHFSMRKEVSKIDVLRAIKMALMPWRRPQITFGDHAYLLEANLPSGVSEQYVGVCWDETSVDGALSETCKTVEAILQSVVGSKLLSPKNSFSARRNKDDRPFIESFFRQISSHGFQQLGNTTGSDSRKKLVKKPEEIAIARQFQFEYAKELLDVLIANYNATPHYSLGGRSPLEYFRFKFSQEADKRYADQNSVMLVVSYRKECTVLGGYKSGRLPYVNFLHGRYGSDILSQRHDLVGKKIWLVTHIEDDIRIVLASTKDGQSLGLLTVRAPWNKLPHSMEVRTAVYSIISKGKLNIPAGSDAVETFIHYCEQQVGKKLPIHPAYMEARRVLIEVTSSVSGDSPGDDEIQMVDQQEELATDAPQADRPKNNSRHGLRPLPAHRKAAD